MSIFLNVVVSGLQVPAPGFSVSDARELATNISTGQDLPADDAEETAKAVQDQQMEPASGTPESTENGEVSVKTQPTHEGA